MVLDTVRFPAGDWRAIYPVIVACMSEGRNPTRSEMRSVAQRVWRECLAKRFEHQSQPIGFAARRTLIRLVRAALTGDEDSAFLASRSEPCATAPWPARDGHARDARATGGATRRDGASGDELSKTADSRHYRERERLARRLAMRSPDLASAATHVAMANLYASMLRKLGRAESDVSNPTNSAALDAVEPIVVPAADGRGPLLADPRFDPSS